MRSNRAASRILALACLGAMGGCTQPPGQKTDNAELDIRTAEPSHPTIGRAAEPAATTDIPEYFHGEWDVEKKYCGGDDPGHVTIAKDQILYFEARGSVRRMQRLGPDEVRVELAMETTDGGRTQIETLTLGPGGDTLTLGSEPVRPHRVRC